MPTTSASSSTSGAVVITSSKKKEEAGDEVSTFESRKAEDEKQQHPDDDNKTATASSDHPFKPTNDSSFGLGPSGRSSLSSTDSSSNSSNNNNKKEAPAAEDEKKSKQSTPTPKTLLGARQAVGEEISSNDHGTAAAGPLAQQQQKRKKHKSNNTAVSSPKASTLGMQQNSGDDDHSSSHLLLGIKDIWVKNILPFVGPGHFIYVAGVSKDLKQYYLDYYSTVKKTKIPKVTLYRWKKNRATGTINQHPHKQERKAIATDTYTSAAFCSVSRFKFWDENTWGDTEGRFTQKMVCQMLVSSRYKYSQVVVDWISNHGSGIWKRLIRDEINWTKSLQPEPRRARGSQISLEALMADLNDLERQQRACFAKMKWEGEERRASST